MALGSVRRLITVLFGAHNFYLIAKNYDKYWPDKVIIICTVSKRDNFIIFLCRYANFPSVISATTNVKYLSKCKEIRGVKS